MIGRLWVWAGVVVGRSERAAAVADAATAATGAGAGAGGERSLGWFK